MTIHTLEPDRRTLHGHFSPDLPPVLTIDPGNTVRFRTLDAGWGIEPPTEPGSPTVLFEPRVEGEDDGHAPCWSRSRIPAPAPTTTSCVNT